MLQSIGSQRAGHYNNSWLIQQSHQITRGLASLHLVALLSLVNCPASDSGILESESRVFFSCVPLFQEEKPFPEVSNLTIRHISQTRTALLPDTYPVIRMTLAQSSQVSPCILQRRGRCWNGPEFRQCGRGGWWLSERQPQQLPKMM